MKITYGAYTQTMRYVKEGGEVVWVGEVTQAEYGPRQIVTYKDKDGIEHNVNILHPNVKNVVIK
jgi:hypothetical protein